MDISISIASYNTADLLKRCLNSIYKHTKGLKFEVIVVDNRSKDRSVEMVKKNFPRVKIIANKTNKFFSKANNQALKIASGKYFLILNSDTYFTDNSLKKMVDYMEKNTEIGACEGIEVYEDGRILQTGSGFSTPLIDFFELSILGTRLKNKKLINRYRLVEYDRRENFEIDVGCDAFLMVRKMIMDKIGGYDKRFLLYYTENDLCLRIKKLGYKIMHLGDSQVMHRVSASVEKIGWKKTDIYYKDLFYYYKKHGFQVTGALLFLLLKLEGFILKRRVKK